MNANLISALADEISFINDLLAYDDTDELEYMTSLDDASTQIEGMRNDYDGNDMPEGLLVPETMLLVWNYVISDIKRRAAEQAAKRQDDTIRKEHPDWIEFPECNIDSSSVWFDPADLKNLLLNHGYSMEQSVILLDALDEFANRK